MNIISFNGVTLSTVGVRGFLQPTAPGEQRQAQWLSRADAAPVLAAMTRPGRTLPCRFMTVTSIPFAAEHDRLLRLLGVLDPNDPTPRPLVIEIPFDDDLNGVPETTRTLAALVTVGPYAWSQAGPAGKALDVTFHTAEDTWHQTTNATDGPNSLTVSGTFSVTNAGLAPARPQIRVAWTAQRNSDESAYLGWKYRVLIPVANTGDRAWTDELIPIRLGDTTALTTTKARADGWDVRFRLDGREIPRQLINWDTALTIAVLPLTLGAGETANLELVYGNPQASNPRTDKMTLDTYAGTKLRGYAAWDMGSDSGTATSGAASTLTDSGKAWVVNRWAGATIQLVGGTSTNETRRVVSNTATTITVDRAWQTAPDATSVYVVRTSGFAGWGGVRSAGGSGPTLTDSSAIFPPNGLIGGVVEIHNGTGAGYVGTITANTATVITATPDFPALGVSSEYRVYRWGFASWYVDAGVEHSELWRGRWRLNRHQTPPSRVWFKSDGIPGAWERVLTLPNRDDFRQLKWSSILTGSDNDYYPLLDVRRKRGSEDTFDEEGIADGAVYSSPLGIRGIRFDYDYTNESGVGKIVLLSKAPGGETWAIEHETTATQATLTALALTYVDLTPQEGELPIHIAQAVWPADGVEIPDTADQNNEANVQDDETVEVYLDTARITIGGLSPSAYVVNFASEQNVYDLQASIGYGATIAASTHFLRIGRHATLDEDEQGGWFHLVGGDVLVIDCAAGELFTYTGSISASSYTAIPAAHAAVVYERVDDPDNPGATRAIPASSWMPMEPGTFDVAVEEVGMGTLDVFVLWGNAFYA